MKYIFMYIVCTVMLKTLKSLIDHNNYHIWKESIDGKESGRYHLWQKHENYNYIDLNYGNLLHNKQAH